MANLPIIYLTNYPSPGLTAQHEWRNMSLRTAERGRVGSLARTQRHPGAFRR
jgi:hypothetical protein